MTREEAIMAVKEVTEMSLPWNDRHYESLQMAIKALEILPSAQPEIIRCKECKYYRDGDCWHEWDNDGRIYYQSVIDEPNPDDYCSWAERKEHELEDYELDYLGERVE